MYIKLPVSLKQLKKSSYGKSYDISLDDCKTITWSFWLISKFKFPIVLYLSMILLKQTKLQIIILYIYIIVWITDISVKKQGYKGKWTNNYPNQWIFDLINIIASCEFAAM